MTVDSAAGRRRCCQKRIRISTCINIRKTGAEGGGEYKEGCEEILRAEKED